MENFIIPFIVPFVLGIIFAFAGRSKALVQNDGSILLQYCKAMKFVGISLPLSLWIIFAFAVIDKPPDTREELQAFLLMFFFPALLLGYFYLELFKVRIILNEVKIEAHTPWQGSREYFWSGIKEITYSPSFRWFRIRSEGEKNLYISAFITDIEEFINCMRIKLREPVYRKALQKFENG